MKSLSRVRLLATPWAAVYQAPLSMGFSRQEYWSGVPLPSPVMANMFMYIWVLQILKNEKKKMNSIQAGKHLCQNNVKLNKQCVMRAVITCSMVMLGHAVCRLVCLSAIINLSVYFAS